MKYLTVFDPETKSHRCVIVPNRKFRKSAQRFLKTMPQSGIRAANLRSFCLKTLPMLSSRLDRQMSCKH